VEDSGTSVDGEYLELTDSGDDDVASFGTSTSSASLFTFNDECNLLGAISGEIANVNEGATYEELFFNTAAQISSSGGGFVPAICSISNNQLFCDDDGNTFFLFCIGLSFLVISNSDNGCEQIGLTPLFT
jgi:hypothetical protein